MSQSEAPGLDTLVEGSHYALDQLHGEQKDPSAPLRKSSQPRDALADARSTIRKTSSATPVRRRISRACDQCNQLRTKCDGQNPCAHCLDIGLDCEYARERKKRGKTSKKDLAAAASTAITNGDSSLKDDNAHMQGQSPHAPQPHEANGRYDSAFDATRELPEHTPSHLPSLEAPNIVGIQQNTQSTQAPPQQPIGSNIEGLPVNHYGGYPSLIDRQWGHQAFVLCK
ncbi:hypothetical protein NUU61_004224 [Penicillium alfredii]|uniref:Xylanolytic transcriptional activator xlnR n=1 Tax=Penicillium alfredii TaxID=1506179 RepID=A0A9W9KEF6_9EURO|nr:uncharacterized protein NUU61_004224 [Penicillium alfredii]KAJ5102002.1 hypothetical protein NUU61_004224 [Penicillium alfredii]